MKRILSSLLLFPLLANAGTTIKDDTFTVSGGDVALESHTSTPSGGGWQGTSANFDVLDATDNVSLDTTSVRTIIGDENPTETDYYVEVTCTTGNTASTHRCGLVSRADGTSSHQASSSSYYAFRVDGNASAQTWTIIRVDAGTPDTTVGDCTNSGTLTGTDTDDPIKLKWQQTGTGATVSISMWWDADIDGGGFSGYTLIQNCSDTEANRITSAGNVGLYMRNTGPRADDFYAEDLTSGGVTPHSMHLMRQHRQ